MKVGYAHGVSSELLIGVTIGDSLDKIAGEYPGNEALVSVFENRR
jgi:hypothetical protein